MPVSPFSITGERVPSGATVVGFRGREAISRPYEYEVLLSVPEGALTAAGLRDALHSRATLAFHRDDGEVRRVVHGVFTAAAIVRALPGGASLVRMTLGPALSRLAHGRRNRVWVDKSVLAVVGEVLRESGLRDDEIELRIEVPASYGAVDQLCQYRESNLDFVSRRLEAEGVYYYFEHAVGARAEVLVLSDSRSFVTPLTQEGVRFTPVGDDDTSTVEGLRTFEFECVATPDGARTRGGDYLFPDLDVSGSHPREVSSAFVSRELDSTRNPAVAARHARVAAEAQSARSATVYGEGRSYELAAGFSFDFEEHPILAGEYLATAVTMEGFDIAGHRALASRLGYRGEDFFVTVEAIAASVQFRPERVTAVPSVQGHELGVVRPRAVGSAQGRNADLDEHGRYLVKLRFDDDDSKTAPSVRMRMAQPHAGASDKTGGTAGAHMPLRAGTEVLVGFLRGDPDLPYIAAAVPEAHTPSPVTSNNPTQHVMQTPGGNRIVMEDKEGAEYIELSTPYKSTKLSIGAPHNPAYEFDVITEGPSHVGADRFEIDARKYSRTFVGKKAWEEYGTPANPDEDDARRCTPSATSGSSKVFTDAQFEALDATHRRKVYGDAREEVTGVLTQRIGPPGHVDKNAVVHNVDVFGKRDETIHGEDTVEHKGHSKETFHGIREEYFMGTSVEASLMARFEFALEAISSITAGAGLEVNIGPRLGVCLGADITLRHGLVYENEGMTMKQFKLFMESGPLKASRALLNIFI